MSSPYIEINGRRIGSGYPVYIIAELSANHRHNYNEAVELVKQAKSCGADAIKLQTYTPDTITINVDSPIFSRCDGTLWEGKSLYELYSEAYMPWEWQPKLKKLADNLGITLFSTPFDKSSVDFLEKVGVPAYKVASFEIVDTGLIEYIASKGKPVIISTGMATLPEIKKAVQSASKANNSQLALLKCTSAYPCSPEEMNLKTIAHMTQAFCLPVGLSDHTLGITVPIAAVAAGACIIEKHFILSRRQPSPDSAFSLEPTEFQSMVEAVRTTEKAMGEVRYGINAREINSHIFRRSLFVIQDIKVNDVFTEDNVRSIRPGNGLPPCHLNDILGRKATRDIPRGTPLSWEMIAK